MEHDFCATYALVEARYVEDVTFDKFKVGMPQRFRNKFSPAGGEIVVTNNSVPPFEEPINKIAADEPGGSGHKSAHYLVHVIEGLGLLHFLPYEFSHRRPHKPKHGTRN